MVRLGFVIGTLLPVALLAVNLALGYGGILVTIGLLVWLGARIPLTPPTEANPAAVSFAEYGRVSLSAGDVAAPDAFSVPDRHSDERTTASSGQTETPPGCALRGTVPTGVRTARGY